MPLPWCCDVTGGLVGRKEATVCHVAGTLCNLAVVRGDWFKTSLANDLSGAVDADFLVVLAALAPKSEASRVALAGSLFGQGRKAIIFQNQYRIQASFADHLVGFHFASKHGLLGA